jgi:methylmalonyl-CoA/ethylmalonyl-CoA epimerase
MTAPNPVSHIRGLDHVAIVVHSVEVAMEFYSTVLGLVLTNDQILAEIGVRLAYLAPGASAASDRRGCCIQLVQPVAPGPIAEFLAVRGEGLHHVCFVVPDIATALADFNDEVAQPFAGGRSSKVCFLTARPNGCVIELVEEQQATLTP